MTRGRPRFSACHVAAVAVLLLATSPVRGDICRLQQVTHTAVGYGDGSAISNDGRWAVWDGNMDPVGANSSHNLSAFLFDARSGSIVQLTPGGPEGELRPTISADGRWVAFQATQDLTGENPGGNRQIFLYSVEARRVYQVTHVAGDPSQTYSTDPSISGDGARIAFRSTADLVGQNADGNVEIFYLDRNAARFVQISRTTSPVANNFPTISRDGDLIAFSSAADLTGGNPDGGEETFLYSVPASTITQVTSYPTPACDSGAGPKVFDAAGAILFLSSNCNLTGANVDSSLEVFEAHLSPLALTQVAGSTQDSDIGAISDDGSVVAVSSRADYVGQNADGSWEVFLVRSPGGIEQVTVTTDSWEPSLDGDGRVLVYSSRGDPLGENSEHNLEIFRRVCYPDPPSAIWLTTGALPGFEFQVRVSSGGTTIPTRQESSCLSETLCISGAVPGRSELFLRIVGPKPNGYLWPNVVKFSTSRIEVWVRQLASGEVQYYDLPQTTADSGELPGLFDRTGFLP